MALINVGMRDAVSVSSLLLDLSAAPEPPSRLRDAARHWSSAMGPEMRSEELQTVIWLLREFGGHRRVDEYDREACRFWAMRLTG